MPAIVNYRSYTSLGLPQSVKSYTVMHVADTMSVAILTTQLCCHDALYMYIARELSTKYGGVIVHDHHSCMSAAQLL